jgi:hypothetical protein
MATLSQIKTPVVLITFNRPDTTKKVFDVIRKVKPTELFLISDGARQGKKKEDELSRKHAK